MQSGRTDSRYHSGGRYFRDGLVLLIPLQMIHQEVNFAGTVGAAGYHVATSITLRLCLFGTSVYFGRAGFLVTLGFGPAPADVQCLGAYWGRPLRHFKAVHCNVF